MADGHDLTLPEGQRKWQGAARTIIAVTLLALGVWTIREFLPSLIWASIIAVATWPLFCSLKRHWPGGRSNIFLPLLCSFTVLLLFVLPMIAAGFQAAREAHAVLGVIEKARTDGLPAPTFLSSLPVIGDWSTRWWNENLASPEASAALLQRLDRAELISTGRHIGVLVVHRLIQFGFCLLTLFFLFRDGERIAQEVQLVAFRALGPGGLRLGRQIVSSVHGTVDGLVLVGLGEGVILGLAYAVLGVPNPTLFGLVTAIAAMIPFGAPIAFGLAALTLVAKGAIAAGVSILVLGFLVTFVADHFIRPVLIGGATKLPFLWVLFGILGGVATWGLLGLFLGPAVMAALIMLWREWCGEAAISPD